MATILFVYVVGFLFCTTQNRVGGEPVSFYTFYKEVRVGQFSNFGSLQLIDLNVPPLTVSLICDVRGSRAPASCPIRNINIYWQYGSIPVAEYLDKATFPKGFILHRSYLNSTILPSDDLPVTLRLENPVPGTWFLAAFVEKKDDQVIKKITNVDCSYGMQVNVTTILTLAVSDIEAENSLKLLLNSSESLFRFFVAGDVYKYSVSLSCVNKSRCPLLLSARASGIPTNGNDTVNVNCTSVDSSTCQLNFASPAVDQWHYLRIACLQDHAEVVILFVHLFGCRHETSEEQTRKTAPTTTTATTSSSPASISSFEPNSAASSSTLTAGPTAANASSTLTPNPAAPKNILTPSLIVPSSNTSTPSPTEIRTESQSTTTNISASDHATVDSGVVPDHNITYSSLSAVNSENGSLLLTSEETFSQLYEKHSLLSTASWNKTSALDGSFPAVVNPLRFVAGGNLPRVVKTGVPLNRMWNALASDVHCLSPARFSQVVDVDNTLSTIFSVQPMSSETLVIAATEVPYLMRFDLHPIRDIGATLKIQAQLHEVHEAMSQLNSPESVVTMKVCFQRSSIPLNDVLELSCLTSEDFFHVTPANQSVLRWYPYPEPGPWFIGVQKVCYRNVSERVSCNKTGAISFKVMMTPCMDDSCRNSGNCVEYGKSVYAYAACQCIAGYRGYACDDDAEAASSSLQMAFSFFLSMSNLLFIPVIGVALWRRRYPEALVYFSNMFFSSFYHACDMSTWSRYKLCIMPYHVLSFCDFYCSMLSFWVTLTAMARLPVMLRSVAHMAGAVALAMAMKWNMHGVITNVVPIVVGAGMVIVSWAVHCGRLRRLFPQKRSLLWTIPGVALAGLGICLFAFVETDSNYPYTHSVWHVCMAVSVIFLLPRSKVEVKDESSSADTSSFQFDDFNDTSELITADFSRSL